MTNKTIISAEILVNNPQFFIMSPAKALADALGMKSKHIEKIAMIQNMCMNKHFFMNVHPSI